MGRLNTAQFVAANCTKTAGEAAIITAGADISTMAKGVHYFMNEKSQVIISDAMVVAAKNFRLVHSIKGSSLISPAFELKNVKAISGNTPKVYQGKRIVIGKLTGLTTENAEVLPSTTYSVGMILEHFKNPDIIFDEFMGAGTSYATGDLTAPLYIDIINTLHSNEYFTEYFTACAHTASPSTGTVTVTIAKDSTYFSASAALEVGSYVAFQDVSVGATPRPRAMYKVVAFDTINNTGELSSNWISGDYTGLIDVVEPTDTDELALFIESKLAIYEDSHYPQAIGTEYQFLSVEPSNFEINDIHQFSGTPSQGDFREVAHQQALSYQRLNDGTERNFVTFVNEDKMYAAVNLAIELEPTSLSVKGIAKHNFNIHLEKGTIAETNAGTVIPYGTNILEGDGTLDSPAGALINVINAIGLRSGVLRAGLNTTFNGGALLKKDLDY